MGAGTREKSKAMLGGSQMLTWFLTQFSDMYENKCFFFFFLISWENQTVLS
jgi:hypothetical protein